MNKELQTLIEEQEKEFGKRVIGETFAGGTFNDTEGQKLYTGGYTDGFREAKRISKAFLRKSMEMAYTKGWNDSIMATAKTMEQTIKFKLQSQEQDKND